MAVLLDERIVQLELTDLLTRRPLDRDRAPATRAPGVHQSDILQHIAYKVGWLKEGEVWEEDRGLYPWRWCLGQMWEEFWFSLQDSETTTWQPGEVTEDGISVNCDGISTYYNSDTTLEETKCTEAKVKSGEDFLAHNLYMYQGKAYCHVYGCELVRWTVLYYRGDWKGSGPVCKQYLVRFTPKEVEQAWLLLLKFKPAVEKELNDKAWSVK